MDEKQGMDSRTAARLRTAAQEQARYGVGGLGQMGGPINECAAPERDQAYQDPLRVRVDRRLQRMSEDAQDLMRIQALLNEHPEFEKFIELQNLLNRRGI